MNASEIKRIGTEANTSAWRLLGKETLSTGEKSDLLSAAYASLYCFKQIGTDLNRARGHWLVSRALCVLQTGSLALIHAELCANFTERSADKKDFDRFYSYEALARSYAAIGDTDKAKDFFSKAEGHLDAIKNAEDKSICAGDFKSGPWFGIDLAAC